MDEKIEQKIDEEILSALNKVHTLVPGSKEYREAMEAIAVLRKSRQEDVRLESEIRDKAERREEERLNHGDELDFRLHEQEAKDEERKRDAELKQREQEAKDEERKQENKHRWIESTAKVLGVVLPSALYAYFGVKGMKFEQTGTFTSSINKLNLGQIFRLHK